MTRSIDLDDPFDLSIEEKIFLNAKRLCIIFAGMALTLSALDLINEHAVENGAEYIHHVVGANIRDFSFGSASPSVAVTIPTTVAKATPITELAAVRHQNAVLVAMMAPPVMPPMPTPWLAQQPAPKVAQTAPVSTALTATAEAPGMGAAASVPAAGAPATFQLASISPDAIPQATPIEPAITLPPVISVLPVRPPPLSPAQRLHLHGASRVRAEACLARAIYFEARNQPFRGQVGVAQVVMNRVFSPFYPDNVCGVIYQNASHHLACQFTFACDGRSKVIRERGAWARARRIARETLDGKLYVRAVGTATHYHAVYVHPAWVHEMRRIVREGIHTFYRPIAWGSGADLPIYSREELASYRRRR